jgi:hypothetical protein
MLTGIGTPRRNSLVQAVESYITPGFGSHGTGCRSWQEEGAKVETMAEGVSDEMRLRLKLKLGLGLGLRRRIEVGRIGGFSYHREGFKGIGL